MSSFLHASLFLLLTLCAVGLGCSGNGESSDPDGFTQKKGSLRTGDDALTSGEFSDVYTVSANIGQWIEVAMISSEIDPYLILKPPSCPETGQCEQQLDNDDLQSGDTRSVMFYNANQNGVWQIIATSSSPGETGDYELSYRVVEDGTPPAIAGIPTSESGFNSSGSLGEGDKTLTSGEYVDNFAFFGTAGESVTIDLRSSDFDPYLILFKPDKSQDENDDFNGSGEHSRLAVTLSTSGIYRVAVTSFQPGETGAYTVSIKSGEASGPEADAGDTVPFEKN